jgi:hypothetical protein
MGKCKLIMLNNKASIDKGSWFFYSISNKTKVILIRSYMCWRLLLLYINTEFSRAFYKSHSNNDNSQQGPPHQIWLRAPSPSVTPQNTTQKSISFVFCVSSIRHDSSLSKYRKQKQSPPGNTQNGTRPGGWLLLFTVLAEWRIMTNSAYAKNKGDGLLCSILWLRQWT